MSWPFSKPKTKFKRQFWVCKLHGELNPYAVFEIWDGSGLIHAFCKTCLVAKLKEGMPALERKEVEL